MANNEVNAVPAANYTTSSGSSTGPAAGPLAVSETNPRYFTVAARDRQAGGVSDRVARQQQLPRWFRSRRWLLGNSRAERLPRLPRVPQGARSQLRPAVALGAVQVAGRGGRLPLLHDAATVAPHRARIGEGRQAEVRPLEVRPGLLRPAARL